MQTILLFILLAANVVTLYLLLKKKSDNGELERFAREVFGKLEEGMGRVEHAVRYEVATNRQEAAAAGKATREEIGKSIKDFGDSVGRNLQGLTESQNKNFRDFADRLDTVIERNEAKVGRLQEAIEKRLDEIRKDNGEKLEKMRETVDEKLHATLEKRLGDSFKLVSDRLDLVHRGLGEMQTLATGVGDLKKVLQNVKTRGILGEIQLGNILDDILTPEQYDKNVATKQGSNDRVEFAIKLPGRDEKIQTVWLPLDSKFPMEDYQALVDASERGDSEAVEKMSKSIETKIKLEAKDIRDKYLDPPYTTEFGILFLPFEGLYAEVLRRPGLVETIRRDYKVVVTGPTTVAAFLSSLQMGFRTLVIEKRSSEVWALLATVKKEFVLFGDILDKTHKKLQEASNTIERASSKSRNIERKLGKVQELPTAEGSAEPELAETLPPVVLDIEA
jgi:DNA recombination protein RmuC